MNPPPTAPGVEGMADVLEQHLVALQKLFCRFAGATDVFVGSDVEVRMTQAQFLEFAQHFNVCPGLIARLALVELFEETCGALQCSELAYAGFCTLLGQCALFLFSGPEWDAQYADPRRKLQLLLFWMDQGSRTFRNNGDDLMRHFQGAAAAEDHLDGLPVPAGAVRESTQPPLPRVAALDDELQAIFSHYCAFGDRLNRGPGATMTNAKFTKFVRECGLVGGGVTLGEVDVIFERVAAESAAASAAPAPMRWKRNSFVAERTPTSMVRRRMGFDDFYRALGELGRVRYPLLPSRAAALHQLVLEAVIPIAIQLRPPSAGGSHHSSALWRQRWRELQALDAALREPEVVALFHRSAAGLPPPPSTPAGISPSPSHSRRRSPVRGPPAPTLSFSSSDGEDDVVAHAWQAAAVSQSLIEELDPSLLLPASPMPLRRESPPKPTPVPVDDVDVSIDEHGLFSAISAVSRQIADNLHNASVGGVPLVRDANARDPQAAHAATAAAAAELRSGWADEGEDDDEEEKAAASVLGEDDEHVVEQLQDLVSMLRSGVNVSSAPSPIATEPEPAEPADDEPTADQALQRVLDALPRVGHDDSGAEEWFEPEPADSSLHVLQSEAEAEEGDAAGGAHDDELQLQQSPAAVPLQAHARATPEDAGFLRAHSHGQGGSPTRVRSRSDSYYSALPLEAQRRVARPPGAPAASAASARPKPARKQPRPPSPAMGAGGTGPAPPGSPPGTQLFAARETVVVIEGEERSEREARLEVHTTADRAGALRSVRVLLAAEALDLRNLTTRKLFEQFDEASVVCESFEQFPDAVVAALKDRDEDDQLVLTLYNRGRAVLRSSELSLLFLQS